MSFEAYSVAVRLKLIDGVSSGLVALAGQFSALNLAAKTHRGHLDAIEGQLSRLKTMGLIGGAMAAAGGYGLSLFKGPIHEAIEYGKEFSKLRQMGLGDAQISDAKKFIEANSIIGTSMQQRARLFVEAQGAFRESGMDGSHALDAAKKMMPILAEYENASALLSGEKGAAAAGAMRSLNKTVEIMGGITDTKRAGEIADGVFKAVQSSGRMIDERQLKQFVAYGSSATNSIDMRALFGGLEPLIGEFGGSTVGTGLRTAFTRMSGAMSMPPKKMQGMLTELGIGTQDHGSVRLKDDLLSMMQTDPVAFAKQMMQIYEQHGITSVLGRERANAQIFGTNGAKIYNKVMSQMPVLEESLKAFDKAKGAKETIEDNKDSPLAAMNRLQKSMSDFSLVIGDKVLPLFTRLVDRLYRVTDGVVKFTDQFPVLTKWLVVGFGVLSGVVAVGGVLMLATAGFKAVGIALAAVKGEGVAAMLTSLGGSIAGLGATLGKLGLLGAAGFAGWEAGKLINEHLSDNAKEWIGEKTAKVAAFFGNEDAKEALRINSVKPGQGKVVQVSTNISLDGRSFAKVVTQHQATEAGRPAGGFSGFDPNMGVAPFALTNLGR